ncbi:serine/threonine-protein kinase MHK-like isoform X1 [Durio zibethinus]|uniref:cyclin-dependent kinase n=3 Tax=Durio zibethinus TaxID=66656 RepID=A0A6P6B2U7_DURZI|nr:serine/threonine-protein kinase MHK-like isoform X1 [Durio zibethinus]XP_022771517.1 serine/threonine-protein kinase MHK-like isoform X1 [Durio zibethinus]XP_022771518.1 serine/threonine-protein kinase MHK-like isoform X1 [Durio zibethinus]XP_022771519.1 serine/threonine-protein kinase MHK-like isoform X1 [Durio zibethinus]XP_022771520.1 serine/threonine-protein kinase MHK-like isoform X1 [Durio zibethinus]XP_022771522.1 serine/threonine-protein kinase MHK-like isoform X1 [Durio zibethinus]
MERYKILEELGDGTCGSVFKAFNTETFEIVAVKKMKRKFYFWEECMNLGEVKALRKLNHPNIVKLKEVVRENNELFFIFEYMEHNLYQIMRERQRPFSEGEIRSFMSQMLQGLAHMHRHGYFHRDLKPENLLVTKDVLKIADFGLAREVSSMPPYTEYVSTRWYRAPEVLLQSSSYTPAIDMWAVGAILAELFTSYPIFPGESEIDQLYKICCVLGAPDWTSLPEATNISRLINISYSEILPTNISDIIPNASSEAVDLVMQLCSWDPLRRPTADQALQHPFFNVHACVPHPLLYDPLELRLNNMGMEPNLELNLWDFDTEPDDCFLGLTLAVKPSVSNLEVVHNASQGTEEDILFCPRLKDHPEQSVFWSLLTPGQNGIHPPVESTLSFPFREIFHGSSIQHPPIGVPQSAGFAMASLQPNLLERQLLAVSSPFQQGHYL